jgi:hypothetical protein
MQFLLAVVSVHPPLAVSTRTSYQLPLQATSPNGCVVNFQ